jgi:hypothetical protein
METWLGGVSALVHTGMSGRSETLPAIRLLEVALQL